MTLDNLLVYSSEVKAALADAKPVVAMESTIISHGMPYPQNVKMAGTVEQIIRDNGATPATIAIMDGKIRIGLEPEDLQTLATAEDVAKVSRRDLAEILAAGKTGATTVATTMICAHYAGIKVFVTGGIGGVHRGVEHTMDISADLEELGKTPVTVVCAGAKAILDLPRTLEYLETKGVPVIGYQTDVFPAFYSATSDYKLNSRADTTAEIAERMKYAEILGLAGGAVVTVPVPKVHEIPHAEIDGIIEQALAEMEQAGISGKDATPFLLAKIVELTDGRSLKTNIQLVYNNAKVGARIAIDFAKL